MEALNVNFETTLQAANTLKKYFKEKYGMTMKGGKVGSNTKNPADAQYIEIRVSDFRVDVIPNEFRKVCIVAGLNATPLNWDNICYGNIQNNRVSLKGFQWRKVLEALNAEK